jgi:hypothetical protein
MLPCRVTLCKAARGLRVTIDGAGDVAMTRDEIVRRAFQAFRADAEFAAVAGEEVVLLTVRSWPRDDVEAAMERIVGAFEILARDAGASRAERV